MICTAGHGNPTTALCTRIRQGVRSYRAGNGSRAPVLAAVLLPALVQVGVEELDPPVIELRIALAEELADIYLYLDLLATKAGIDLPTMIRAKFNEVSERQDFPERL